MIKTGVFGLGLIGSIWARHLQADGLLAGGWNRTPQPDFPGWCPDPVDLVRRSEVLILVVSDPPAVSEVLECILPALTTGHTVMQCSTIDPASSKTFRNRVAATGAGYLEAPFSGSKPGAEARQTVFYLGGNPAVIERIQPMLDRLSQQQHLVGTSPQAAAFKLASNLAIASQVASVCESLTLSREQGLSDDTFFDLLKKNMVWSGAIQIKQPKWTAGEFSPQFAVRHMLKDLRLARDSGAISFPVCEAVIRQLEAAVERGWQDHDFSILLRLLGPGGISSEPS